jgi:osmotically-inducible protein OsmY
MSDRFWDREREERARRSRGEGYYESPERERERERDWVRRGEERGFFDRAGDEVRSWFGDEEAQRRRLRDERDERTRWNRDERGWSERGWGERGTWPGRERGWGEERRGSPEEPDREWARQWGYTEGRGQREPERGWSRGWGYSGGYGAGAGYLGSRMESPGGRLDWSTSYEPGASSGVGWRGAGWQGPHVGRGPRGYRRSDDRVREDICEQMCQCGDLDPSDIEIVVVNGEVTLQGTVTDRYAKRLAEDLTERVSGVREVNNQIRVTQGGAQQDEPNRPFRAA